MQKDRLAERTQEIQTSDSQERVLHLRPLGSQGPKISVGLKGEKDYRKLDEEMGKLTETERKTFEGIRMAAKNAGLPLVDS